MIGQHLLKNVRISHICPQYSFLKASTLKAGYAVDMQGFEGCVFIAIGSTKIGRAATTSSKMFIQGASATGGTFKTIAGTSSTGAWSSGSRTEKLLVVDVYKPLSTQRHLRPLVCGASTDALLGIIAIQYGMRKPGATDLWKSSTRAGSSRWQSTMIGGQRLAVSATATTKTTG